MRAGVRTAGAGGQHIRALGLRHRGQRADYESGYSRLGRYKMRAVPFFCLATKCEYIYEVSLVQVKINLCPHLHGL